MEITFRYDVHAGSAGDGYADSGIMTFEWQEKPGNSVILILRVWDKPAYIVLSYDGTDFGDEIEVDPNDPPLQIPYSARSFQIRNKTAGDTARFQIVAFW